MNCRPSESILCRGRFRQPEVQNLRLPSICYKDVPGLDVPMDDSFRVRGVQRIGDLDGQIEHCFDIQWLAMDLVSESLQAPPSSFCPQNHFPEL
jgi:hypothetical protein